jgi:hypothetical protein
MHLSFVFCVMVSISCSTKNNHRVSIFLCSKLTYLTCYTQSVEYNIIFTLFFLSVCICVSINWCGGRRKSRLQFLLKQMIVADFPNEGSSIDCWHASVWQSAFYFPLGTSNKLIADEYTGNHALYFWSSKKSMHLSSTRSSMLIFQVFF